MHRIETGPTRVAQTVDFLRHAMSQKSWTQYLPGERILSRGLGISRPTLRAALEILEHQRWIHTEGSRRRLILPRTSAREPGKNGQKILLLAKEPEKEMAGMSLLYVESLRHRLQSVGLEMEFHFHPMFGRNSPRLVKGLLPQAEAAAAFILFSLPEAVQRHCGERGYPAIVAGSSAPGVNLPSLDVDYQGVGRHAAGTLIGRGHERIALFICNGGLAGDRLTEAGFAETAESLKKRCIMAKIIRHRDESQDIQRKLKALMRVPASRPTGIVVGRARHAVTILCALTAQGLRVPEDVSIICRDFEPMLDWTVPQVGRYKFNPERFARRLAKLAEAVAGGQKALGKACLLVPEFDSAASLAGPGRRI